MTITDEPARVRWLAGPPGWIFGAALLVTVALSLCAVSVPGGIFELILVAFVAWLCLGITYVVRVVVTLANRAGRRRTALWLVFPVVLVACYAVAVAEVPARAGLAVAKSDMLAYARDPGAAEPQRVGPYRVRRVERLPNDGALFHLDAGFLNGTGWAYLPGGAPTSATDEITYTSLGGGWYTFVSQF